MVGGSFVLLSFVLSSVRSSIDSMTLITILFFFNDDDCDDIGGDKDVAGGVGDDEGD